MGDPLASNRYRAATWYWTFGCFHEPEFTRDALRAAMLKWTETLPGKKAGPVSVQRDVEVFLRTDAPSRRGREALEGLLDCPLAELDLISAAPDEHIATDFMQAA